MRRYDDELIMRQLDQEYRMRRQKLPKGLNEMEEVNPRRDIIELLLNELIQTVNLKNKGIVRRTKSKLLENP